MALHSAFALNEGVSKDTVEALRAGRSPQEPRFQALSKFSRALVKSRGHVSDDDLQKVLAAGYSKVQALEVVLGVAVSILPNFAHHLTQCPSMNPSARMRGRRLTLMCRPRCSPDPALIDRAGPELSAPVS